MSQKATRKSQNATAATEEKEKVDTPVKEMKKKLAANAEKDKQTADKSDKPTEKTDKSETADKNKSAEKPDKNGEKSDTQKDKDKPAEKKTDKTEKAAEKKQDKSVEKNIDKQAEKKTDKPVDKKADTPSGKDDKADKPKEKATKPVNGTHNGATSTSNGDDVNGTVSDDSDVELVIEEDEAFPELTYDSDTDADEAPSRSLTRRSQVKATKTPETPAPRPASDTQNDDSKESKVLKLKDDSMTSDRKLRSADSPKPDAKKLEKKAQDSPKKQDSAQEEEKKSTKKDVEASKKEQESEAEKKEQKDAKTEEKSDKMEVEVVVEVESTEGSIPRTRARVSPYSRTRLDRTATSVMADYTGNNSTMEMDITESSVAEESLNDSAYLRGLRGIRGRASYKRLQELTLTNPNAHKPRAPPPASTIRPLGAVVGRKRKPSPSPPPSPPARPVEAGEEASEDIFLAHGKRMKLLDRLSMPFRRSITRRAAEIVGINTDLPLTAPVASTSYASFDPETIKTAPAVSPGEPLVTPLPAPAHAHDRDGKRCSIM